MITDPVDRFGTQLTAVLSGRRRRRRRLAGAGAAASATALAVGVALAVAPGTSAPLTAQALAAELRAQATAPEDGVLHTRTRAFGPRGELRGSEETFTYVAGRTSRSVQRDARGRLRTETTQRGRDVTTRIGPTVRLHPKARHLGRLHTQRNALPPNAWAARRPGWLAVVRTFVRHPDRWAVSETELDGVPVVRIAQRFKRGNLQQVYWLRRDGLTPLAVDERYPENPEWDTRRRYDVYEVLPPTPRTLARLRGRTG